MNGALFLLAALWILWGAGHSLLVGRGARAWAERRLGVPPRRYRLVYNTVAVVTFAPIYLYGKSLDGPVVFAWWGWSEWVTPLLLIAALAYFLAGASVYDLRAFLGTSRGEGRAEAADRSGAGIAAGGALRRDGVLGVVRHPWYAGGFLVLWALEKTAADLVTASMLSLYLLVGTLFEEARLTREFGDAYRAYRHDVSMYVPVRWLRRRARGG